MAAAGAADEAERDAQSGMITVSAGPPDPDADSKPETINPNNIYLMGKLMEKRGLPLTLKPKARNVFFKAKLMERRGFRPKGEMPRRRFTKKDTPSRLLG